MGGHLFVTRGDLRTLHCDHWLLPVDAKVSASDSWSGAEAWRRIRDHLPRSLPAGRRVVEAPWEGPRRPWPTNVASGSRTHASWLAETVRQFLEAASRAPRTLPDRERPLLALPIVGTGHGGKRRFAGDVLREVVPAVYAFLADHEVDVALVTHAEEDFAAAQAARRTCEAAGASVWPDLLRPDLVAAARRLASLGSRNQLVVFMGAGVSASAGLPTWAQLLDQLAVEAGFDEGEREALLEVGALDRAQLLAQRLGPDPTALGRSVRKCLDVGDVVALPHTLLAGLPVREFITTNYDDCFERACASVGRGVARLPYAAAFGSERWLLKMHGCVSEPQDIVLTRRDYVRYAERNAALAGIVQAMLMTRHMVFLGFSLDDDNFHRIVDAVRRALSGAPRGRLGSVVSLFPNRLVEQLWREELDWLHLADDDHGTLPVEARRFELFLDCVSFHATTPHHLLDPRFDGILTDEERTLRAALEPLRAWRKEPADADGDDPVAAARERVDELLRALGDRG